MKDQKLCPKLILCCLILAAFAFPSFAQNYPASLDTTQELPSYSEFASTYLTSGITAGSTTLTVASTASFSTSAYILLIGNEQILATKATSMTFTVVTRGFNGTTAASHSSLSTVRSIWSGFGWTRGAGAIINLETKLGTGSSTPSSGKILCSLGTGSSVWDTPANCGVSGGGGGTPGGSSTQLQYNNSGLFGGTSEFTYSGGILSGKANAFNLVDQTDTTKKAVFDASGISTGTTRTFTFPNTTGTIALTTSNVATATALAADPADCSANNFATAINASGSLTCSQPSISAGVSGLGTGIATFLGTPTSANLASAVTNETGSGNLVFSTSPTFTTPNLGTPSAVTLTNGTGLPISSGVSGLGSGVATFLGTPSSSNLATAVTDETGSGSLVFGTQPSITFGNTGIKALESGGTPAETLTFAPGSALTANRTLTFTTGDASRTITLSGDTTLSGTNTGDQTITLTGDVAGSGTGSFATTIGSNKVTNSMLAQVSTATFKGRTTAGTGNVEDLTTTQATALLNTFTSGAKGLAPASGGGTTNFLRADGAWAAPPGGGGGITNSAGADVIMKSDGTNAVASSLTDDGANITSSVPFDSVILNTPTIDGASIVNSAFGAGNVFNNTALRVLESGGTPSEKLSIVPGSALTADRTFTVTTGDANRTLTLSGDATISGTNTGDQTSVSGNAGTATALAANPTDCSSAYSFANSIAASGDLTCLQPIPRVTAFPGSPSTGDVVQVTDDSSAGACDSAAGSALTLCTYNGSAWVKLGDGTSGGGGIGGTTGSTDNAILRADGTGGSTLQSSPVTIDDSGNITIPDLTYLQSGGSRIVGKNAAGSTVYFNPDNANIAALGFGVDMRIGAVAGNTYGYFSTSRFSVPSNLQINFTGTSDDATASVDVGFKRSAAGEIQVTDGSTGIGNLKTSDIKLRDDSTPSNDLTITNSDNLTADRTLSIATNDANRTLTISGNATVSGTNTGDQTITLTGDVTGSGTSSFATTLATVNSNTGNFKGVDFTVNGKGLVTAASKTTFSKSITISSPTSAEDSTIFFTTEAVTITKMVAVLVGSSSPSVTWTVRKNTDRSAVGTEVVTSGTTTTSTTTGSVVTSFNSAGVSADNFVWLETTALSGTVNELHITIFYTKD